MIIPFSLACIPCPDGTYKNGSGCGPCRHFQKTYQEPFVPQNLPRLVVEKYGINIVMDYKLVKI